MLACGALCDCCVQMAEQDHDIYQEAMGGRNPNRQLPIPTRGCMLSASRPFSHAAHATRGGSSQVGCLRAQPPLEILSMLYLK